ncbi:hypothetical protein CN993_00745 [Bacillus thuringiensis]|uniref:hypothetical protein n=1 Tax=Bacillus thuringiensis TaxID=1428 RepID=UPI000BFD7862|nr:hypothetical protein [Bacillus thuringiensis]PGP49031.1 hypothetical protein CN993_00745 [Bacillus thuringiensis]
MRLRFSDWLDNQEMEDEAKDLFAESIKCYKASAYRAALLFSYLGFQTVIKHRMLVSKTPENYKDSEWINIQKQLQNDETWEKHVIEAIKAKKKPVFKVSEDLYEQYFYWKNRRNDCAHAKGNAIDYPHVESFWLFIESNLSKFVVNGGKAHIIEQIINYLNPSITPVGTDIEPITKQVPFAIELIDYKDFLSELLKITNTRRGPFHFMPLDANLAVIWSGLFTLQADRTKILIEFLKENLDFTIVLLRRDSTVIKYFNGESEFLRILWKEKFSTPLDYQIFMDMIRNNLIPEGQLEELFTHMFNNVSSGVFSQNSFDEGITDTDQIVLRTRKFFDVFYKQAFENKRIAHSFKFGNRNKDLVLYYIINFGLDNTIVSALNSAIFASYPPRHLNEDLGSFYESNKEVWEKHKSICDDLDEIMPEYLEEIIFEYK